MIKMDFKDTKEYVRTKIEIKKLEDSEEGLRDKSREEFQDFVMREREIADKTLKLYPQREHSWNESGDKMRLLTAILRKSLGLKKGYYFPISLTLKPNDKKLDLFIGENKLYIKNDYNTRKVDYNYWGWDYLIKDLDSFYSQIFPKCDEQTQKEIKLFFDFHLTPRGDVDVCELTFKEPKKLEIYDNYDELKEEEVLSLTLKNDGLAIRFKDKENNRTLSFCRNVNHFDDLDLQYKSILYEEFLELFKMGDEKLDNESKKGISLYEQYNLMITPYKMAIQFEQEQKGVIN